VLALNYVSAVVDETFVPDPLTYTLDTFLHNFGFPTDGAVNGSTLPFVRNKQIWRYDALVLLNPTNVHQALSSDWFEQAVPNADALLADLASLLAMAFDGHSLLQAHAEVWWRNIADPSASTVQPLHATCEHMSKPLRPVGEDPTEDDPSLVFSCPAELMAPWAWHPTPALPNEPEGGHGAGGGGDEGVGNGKDGGDNGGGGSGNGVHNDMFRFSLILTGLIGGLGLLATLAFCYGSFCAKKRARRLEKEQGADVDEQPTRPQRSASRTTAEKEGVLGAGAAGTTASSTHRAIGGGSHPATTTSGGAVGRSVHFAEPEAQVQAHMHPQAHRAQVTPPAQAPADDEREHEQQQRIMSPKRIRRPGEMRAAATMMEEV
jgi:hypothetical protein